MEYTLIVSRVLSPCIRDGMLISSVCRVGASFLFLSKFLAELSSAGDEWMLEQRTKYGKCSSVKAVHRPCTFGPKAN